MGTDRGVGVLVQAILRVIAVGFDFSKKAAYYIPSNTNHFGKDRL